MQIFLCIHYMHTLWYAYFAPLVPSVGQAQGMPSCRPSHGHSCLSLAHNIQLYERILVKKELQFSVKELRQHARHATASVKALCRPRRMSRLSEDTLCMYIPEHILIGFCLLENTFCNFSIKKVGIFLLVGVCCRLCTHVTHLSFICCACILYRRLVSPYTVHPSLGQYICALLQLAVLSIYVLRLF